MEGDAGELATDHLDAGHEKLAKDLDRLALSLQFGAVRFLHLNEPGIKAKLIGVDKTVSLRKRRVCCLS